MFDWEWTSLFCFIMHVEDKHRTAQNEEVDRKTCHVVLTQKRDTGARTWDRVDQDGEQNSVTQKSRQTQAKECNKVIIIKS